MPESMRSVVVSAASGEKTAYGVGVLQVRLSWQHGERCSGRSAVKASLGKGLHCLSFTPARTM